MAPAGRPRAPRNRDLPPGVYRRVRGGTARYYDADGKALGPDKARAAQEIARRMVDPIGRTAGTWRHASADYRAWLDDPRSLAALDVAERHAIGESTDDELQSAWEAAEARVDAEIAANRKAAGFDA